MNYVNVSKMEDFIRSANARVLSKIWIQTTDLIYHWGMFPLEELFKVIDTSIPEIYEFIDIESTKKRAYEIRSERNEIKPVDDKPRIYEYLPLGFDSETIEDVIPEIVIIRDKFREAFTALPSGIEKAEAWLYPYALTAGADADLEALVYFKSQGETLISSDELKRRWRNALCNDVEKEMLLNKNDTTIISKAKNKELSLTQLAELYKNSTFNFSFLRARDEEEDFISATFFRAVDWFQLNEFEPWINTSAQEVSIAYQSGVDVVYSLFPFFYLCRSDLLLRKASKFGLEAFFYGLCVGNIEASKPWKRYWQEQDQTYRINNIVDYIPTASIIAFAWQRINPTNVNKTILDQALLLLFQTQLNSGGWPLLSTHTNADILSTYLAMTALSVNKPEGYQRYLEKAKKWLLSQQNEVGCWYIQGGPAVMINVLCIEAIRLSQGDNQITFKIQEHIPETIVESTVKNQSDQYIVFCEGNSGGTKNKDFDEKCYKKIFSSDFPNAIFCSVGACKDIEDEEKLLFDVIRKVNPYHVIIKLIDRDDRSQEEIEELKLQGITVLSLRELESYLLEDEIIKKLCIVCGKEEQLEEVLAIKANALQDSIARGNPIDDLKSASGQFFTNTKRALGLVRCGNDTISFLRDTVAPLVTNETNTYKLLKRDIFGV